MGMDAVPARPALSEAAAVWRAARLLVRSAPALSPAAFVVQGLQGLAPTLVAAAVASALGRLGHGSSPVGSVAGPIAIIGAAVFLDRGLDGAAATLTVMTTNRYRYALERACMAGCLALPGLAHFDDPAAADRLAIGASAGDRPDVLVNSLAFLLRFSVMAAGAAVIVGRALWWAVPLVVAPSLYLDRRAWRQAGERTECTMVTIADRRAADYFRGWALDQDKAREVRLFGLGPWVRARQAKAWDDGVGPVLALMRTRFRRNLAISAIRGALVLVPLVAGYLEFRAGTMGTARFSSLVLGMAALLGGLVAAESFPAHLRPVTRALPQLFAVVDLAESDPRMVTTGRQSPPRRPERGIALEDVWFSYPGGPPVLKGVELWLPAGRSVALVGENGEGKSTVVKLLCRFYDPDSGRVSIDGVDIREMDLDELRARLAVVFQDFVHWPASLADNVAAGSGGRLPSATLDKVLAEAGLSELVATLPLGTGTYLAARFGGIDPSGGEWQRIGLARALAATAGRQASILVLDEPTAAMDVVVEADLFGRFGVLTQGLTTLVISHRFSTVRMADQVAVMSGGRIVETGAHDSLVSTGGPYAQMWDFQARTFRSDPR